MPSPWPFAEMDQLLAQLGEAMPGLQGMEGEQSLPREVVQVMQVGQGVQLQVLCCTCGVDAGYAP